MSQEYDTHLIECSRCQTVLNGKRLFVLCQDVPAVICGLCRTDADKTVEVACVEEYEMPDKDS